MPNYVVFDTKLIYNNYRQNEKVNQSIWPFDFNFINTQLYVRPLTCEGMKVFSLADINEIFLKRMVEAANQYQDAFGHEESIQKAVITVPQYYCKEKILHPFTYNIVEAATLSNIEIIDIIEEAHADLLYYLSNERYSEKIKPGMNVAVFDIGQGTCICKIYEISEHKGKKYVTCLIESSWPQGQNYKYTGRSIDDIIIKELEKSIPESLKGKIKLRTLEAAKEIKEKLSIEENIE